MIMFTKTTMKIAPIAFGLLFLGACATTATPSAEKVTKAESAKAVSENLSHTRTTAKSADGEMICKRTAVTGSRFHRKVCATAEEWDARALVDRQTTESIQRSAGPGVSN